MSLALVTMHNNAFSEIAKMTYDHNKVLYCQKHGYKLFAKTTDFSTGNRIYFDKMRYCLDILNKNPDIKWIWWLDCDALITNFDKKIEPFCDENYICVITCDQNSPNNGSFFLKNCELSKKFLQDVIDLQEQFLDPPWDNAAWNHVYNTSDEYKKNFKVQRQRDFNSFSHITDYHRATMKDMAMTGELNQWMPGDFVVHYAGLSEFPELRTYLIQTMLEYSKELNKFSIKSLNEIYNDLLKKYGIIKYNGELVIDFSDKGSVHTYTNFYEKYLSTKRNKARLLEIGIMTGGSIHLWQQYFENYHIIGVDLAKSWYNNKPLPFHEKILSDKNIDLYFEVDSRKIIPEKLKNILVDFIIDDGNHSTIAQTNTLLVYWNLLDKGGTYFIEDIQSNAKAKKILSVLPKNSYTFEIYEGRIDSRPDDRILAITKL